MLLKLSEKQYPTIKEDVFEKMEENTLTAPRLAGLHEKNIPVAA